MAKPYTWKCKRCGKLLTRESTLKIVTQSYAKYGFKNRLNLNLCSQCYAKVLKLIKEGD